MNDLKKLGFVRFGEWALVDDQLTFTKEADDPRGNGFVYAFVQSDKIRYIGKTGMYFRSRLDNYKYGKDPQHGRFQNTFRAELEAGNPVTILVYADNGNISFRGETLGDYEELETTLIAHYNPDWNRQK